MWRKMKVRCHKDTDPDDRVISAILIGCYISPIKLKEQTAHFIFYSLNFFGVCFLRRIEVFFPFVQLRWQLAGLLGNAWPAHPAVLISYYIYIFIYTAEFYTILLAIWRERKNKKMWGGGENSNCVSTSIIAFRMGSVFLLFAFPKLAVIFWRTHASHRNIAPWEISRSFSLTEIANVYTL